MYADYVRAYLYSLMAAEIKVELSGVRDAEVDGGAGGDVAGLARLLLLVGAEQARVVPLLHHDERDARLILRLQLQILHFRITRLFIP